jgi:dUTPase
MLFPVWTKGDNVNNQQVIQIKYHSKEIEKLRYIDGKSDWIDLRAAENVSLKAGDFTLVSFGISIKIPEGYEAHVVPRSSTFKNFGILQANSYGVIDSSYCGENDIWRMPVYAVRDTEIHVNDRIAQFRIMENQPQIVFEEVERMEGKDRGGFGSTGTK